MWFTLFILLTCLIGIPIGAVVMLLTLVVLLPIHMGGSGYFRENEYAVSGWAKVLAGLVGVVFEYTEQGGHLQVVMGRWVLWQPKEETEGASKAGVASDTLQEKPISEDAPTEEKRITVEPTEPTERIKPTERIESPEPVELSKEQKTSSPLPETPSIPPTSLPEVPTEDDEPQKPSFWSRWQKLRVQLNRYLDYWQEAWPILKRFLKRLMRIFGFRYVDLDVTFGASDPAQTGQLFGYMEAVRPMLGKRASLILTPDFTQSRLDGAGGIEISFYLSRLLWALFALIVRGGVLGGKIWWRERRAKRLVGLEEV